MSEKIARLGIERDNDLMYYIKNGAVWATPRKKPGQAKGKPRMIEDAGVEMDYSKYIYFLDSDGDIARKERASGGGGRRSKKKTNGLTPTKKRKGAKTPRSSITGHYVTEATAVRHPRTTVKETARRRKKSNPASSARHDAKELRDAMISEVARHGTSKGSRDPRIAAFARPVDEKEIAREVDEFLEREGYKTGGSEERGKVGGTLTKDAPAGARKRRSWY